MVQLGRNIKIFFLNLLNPNSGVSSRRFIALLSAPFLFDGTHKGVVYGVEQGRFDFFLSSLLVHAFILYIAYDFFKPSQIVDTIKSIFTKNKTEHHGE
jgi:hypothetical protein